MIIKPYSEISAEAFNAADFPALKHFWHCKQPTAILLDDVVDVVGGADLADTVASVSGNGISIGVGAAVTAVALTAPGTSSCLLISCGTWGATTSGLIYGATSATGGMSIGNASAGAKLFDGTTTKTTTGTQTASDDFTRWTTVRSVSGVPTELMMGETNSSTLDVYTNIVDLTATTAITDVADVADAITIVTSAVTLYGLAFFKFAGDLPPKEVIQAAVAWCDYQWRNNANICMYPGFKGLA
jgi:hypothetical protein